MFVADAHCDTLYEIALSKTRPENCAVTRERLAEGGVGLQTFALFAGSKGPGGTPYRDGIDMLAAAPQTGVEMLTGNLPDEPPRAPAGIFSCEGGEMLEGSLDRLDEFDRAARLRMIALTWNYENEIGHPAYGDDPAGLKPFGKELLAEMDRRGILADASHLNEAGFWDICERAALPPIASHSNCRWLCDTPRNLNREQVRAIIERGGFIGMNFYSRFVIAEGQPTIDDVVRHIDAVCEMGGEHVLGFGSDFDGISTWPTGLGQPADFPALLDALAKRGYTQAQLEGIAGMNLWRLLKRAEAQRKA